MALFQKRIQFFENPQLLNKAVKRVKCVKTNVNRQKNKSNCHKKCCKSFPYIATIKQHLIE